MSLSPLSFAVLILLTSSKLNEFGYQEKIRLNKKVNCLVSGCPILKDITHSGSIFDARSSFILHVSEAFSEPSQTSKMKCFAKIVNKLQATLNFIEIPQVVQKI